jgi:hypothetical protein
MSWEERARKLDSKRRRMRVQGRGLITVEPAAVSKRLKKLHESAGTRRRKNPTAPSRRPGRSR